MPSATSLAVAGGSGSGLLAWGLRYLFSATVPDSCSSLVREAVEAAQHRCEQACVGVDATPSSDWVSLLDRLTTQDWRLFLCGFVLGLGLFLLIDIAFIVKEYWRVRVHTWLRVWVYRQPNLYVLPNASARP